MPKLLRRRETSESNGNGVGEAGPAGEAGEAPPAEPPRPTVAERRDTYDLPRGQAPPSSGALGSDPPIPYEPAPPPPESPRSSGSLLERALGKPGEQSPEERDRVAAMEFEAAIAPVMDLMRAAIPGANSIDDTTRILSENQPEIPRDPEPGAYVPGDAYDNDARVYYRLLRRNYERNPRPSERRPQSHHLHGAYGKLPGTRGW